MPIDIAIKMHQNEAAKLLFAASDMDVNFLGCFNKTLLHHAADCRNTEIVTFSYLKMPT